LNLDDAIDKATNAFFVEGGGKITAENYSAFCHLAEVQTYSIPSDLTSKQLASAQEFLGTLAKDPKQIAEVAELASKAWKTADATAKETESAQDSDDAKENPKDYLGGILLVGKVTKINTNNGLTGAIIRLADNTNFVVLSLKPMGFKVGDEVLLTGGLIAHPAKNIADFKGKSRLVIWFAAMVPLSTAPEAEK
jgi:hypothetical protein